MSTTATNTPNNISLLFCGVGALGSQIALYLARPDRKFTLVDDDRVGEENLATSAYNRTQVGVYKVNALADLLWKKCRARAEAEHRTLEAPPLALNFTLVIDTFDNSQARSLTMGLYPPTLHVGVSAERTGAITWDEVYRLPDGPPRGQNVLCTNMLGAPILRLTAVHAANVVETFLATGERRSYILNERGNIYE